MVSLKTLSHWPACLTALAITPLLTTLANGQTAEIPLTPLSSSLENGAEPTHVLLTLDVQYSDSVVFNPVSGRDEPVRLRSFVNPASDSDSRLLGPLIDARPGQTIRLRINNALPADDPSCSHDHTNINVPHCFNVTNIHAHGLWVSPSGNSDNVFVSIRPGTTFEYEYNLAEDHPAGTYFYHPHHHGSTALQVSSGLAGAFIIRGNRPPQVSARDTLIHGDLDTLLVGGDGTPWPERTVMIQQIPYACRDETGTIRVRDDETWWCADGDVGTIENYDQFGQSTWDRSGRFNTLNGHVMPTFTGSKAGVVERWRLIHAGVRDTVRVQFRKLRDSTAPALPSGQTATERQEFVDENCTGEMLSLTGVALDGLTRGRTTPQLDSYLQPGYREDVLIVFPEPGMYCIIDGEIPAAESVSGRPQERALLGYVAVAEGDSLPHDQAAVYIKDQLLRAARSAYSGPVAERVIADLENGQKLTAFTDHEDIEDDELTGKQTLGFRYHNVMLDPDPPRYQHEVGYLGQDIAGNLILTNAQPYHPDRIDRMLALGGADEWTLASFWGGHPFHIHINPFQIVSITDSSGRDVSGDETGQYAGLKGTWKDTLFIEEGYVFKVRSRYERYIGDFVLHCHILDHEDKGMMQNVRIAPPD